MTNLIPIERIENKILLIRGQKVLLAHDLALLYGVHTKRLNEQVKRNLKRFPPDFMFQLNKQEVTDLKSQIATSSWGGRRVPPFAFTEQGVTVYILHRDEHGSSWKNFASFGMGMEFF